MDIQSNLQKQQLTANNEHFIEISKKLRQCKTCNKFLKGSKSNFNRHFKIHQDTKLRFICYICNNSFSRREHLQKHSNTIHKQPLKRYLTKLEKKHDNIEIKPIKPWKKPFEATTIPKFRIIPGVKSWLQNTPQSTTDEILKEMIIDPELSPLQLSPFRSNNPSPCSSHTSTSTNCQDEKETLNDVNINIYSIYGIFS